MLELYDLAVKVDGDDVLFKQVDYSGNEARIILNVSQLAQIANHVGLTGSTWPRGFLRRLERIRDQADLVSALVESVPCFPPQDRPSPDVEEAARLVEDIDDLLIDFGIRDDPHAHAVTENGISVTPQKVGAGETAPKKRGRPPKEDALTGAERQARYRERQRDLLAPEASP